MKRRNKKQAEWLNEFWIKEFGVSYHYDDPGDWFPALMETNWIGPRRRPITREEWGHPRETIKMEHPWEALVRVPQGTFKIAMSAGNYCQVEVDALLARMYRTVSIVLRKEPGRHFSPQRLREDFYLMQNAGEPPRKLRSRVTRKMKDLESFRKYVYRLKARSEKPLFTKPLHQLHAFMIMNWDWWATANLKNPRYNKTHGLRTLRPSDALALMKEQGCPVADWDAGSAWRQQYKKTRRRLRLVPAMSFTELPDS